MACTDLSKMSHPMDQATQTTIRLEALNKDIKHDVFQKLLFVECIKSLKNTSKHRAQLLSIFGRKSCHSGITIDIRS